MKRYNKITPEGTRDLLFEDCIAQRHVERTLAKAFASRGFHEVVTPGLEFYDVIDPGFSGIGQEDMYKTTDRHGRLVVMRPDSTMPIARLSATRLQSQPKPLRLYYTQKIYRSNPGLAGRSDEMTQTGIELVGAGGRRADLEAIVTAVEALSKCAPDFRLELGHAGFFRALARQLPITEECREEIRRTIESKNYAALNTILDGMKPSPQVDAMRRLPRLFGGEEVFAEAAPLCGGEEAGGTLGYLHDLYRALSSLGLGERMIVDLGLVQRNDYYSGVVFSAYLEDLGDAVLRGGRYDTVLGRFDAPMPAIGFSIDVDALANVLLKHGQVPPLPAADVLVHSDDGREIEGLRYASELAERGLTCESSVFATREESVAYARRCGIRRVDFVGDRIDKQVIEAAPAQS